MLLDPELPLNARFSPALTAFQPASTPPTLPFKIAGAQQQAGLAGRRSASHYFTTGWLQTVNDEHRHVTGDDVLRQFAAELKSAWRSTDLPPRGAGTDGARAQAGLRHLHRQSEPRPIACRFVSRSAWRSSAYPKPSRNRSIAPTPRSTWARARRAEGPDPVRDVAGGVSFASRSYRRPTYWAVRASPPSRR